MQAEHVFTPKDRDSVFRLGPVICMQVYEKRTRKEVGGTIFKAGTMIDTTYIDKVALADPSQSDMPLMQAMVRAGYYSPPEVQLMGNHDRYTWRITSEGAALAERLSRAASTEDSAQ